MKIEIQFLHLQKTEITEKQLLSRVDSKLSSFLKKDPAAKLHIKVMKTRERNALRKPLFACEMVLITSYNHAVMKAFKEGADFHRAAEEALNALTQQLRRRSSKEHHHDRKKKFQHHNWEETDLIGA